MDVPGLLTIIFFLPGTYTFLTLGTYTIFFLGIFTILLGLGAVAIGVVVIAGIGIVVGAVYSGIL